MEALTSAQKAAIIISSIGTENASEVFKHFSDEEVEQITLEIARMNYYPMEVVDSVLNEFYELCLTQKVISEGGVEYARDILEKVVLYRLPCPKRQVVILIKFNKCACTSAG